MSTVGSWAWAQQTDGRLRRRDHIHQVRQGVLARLARMPSAWRSAILSTHPSFTLPDPPDSPLALLAEQHVREISTAELYAHCIRTWLFATLFAQRDRTSHDPELLYLACVLHDLGLTDDHDRRDSTAACFAVEGGRAAHAFVTEHGSSDDRARTVAEAITLHLNVTVPKRLGAEAQLLNKGAALDVVGRRVRELPRASTGVVLQRWPRNGFVDYMTTVTTRQAHARPQSRSAFLHRLGLPKLMAANPLDH